MSHILSQIGWLLIEPINLILGLIVVAAIALWLGRRRISAWLLSVACVLALVPTLIPIGPWLLAGLENRFPPPGLARAPTGIIVLGGAMEPGLARDRNALAINGSVERLLVFAELARRFPEARLVFTGGTGSLLQPGLREADVARPFLRGLGLDIARVTFERNSRNTFENAVFARRLVQPAPGERWLLVTSARHMPRAIGAFRRAGWPVTAFPVDYSTRRRLSPWRDVTFSARLKTLGAALHEWVGLAYYYVTGRSSALFPTPAPLPQTSVPASDNPDN